MNSPSIDHPVCEAVMDLRRLGLSFGQVLELSRCSKPFLIQVYKALQLAVVHKTKPTPFGDRRWLKELVIELSDDDSDNEGVNEIARSLQDKENEIEKMRKYIASLERCPTVKEEVPEKVASEIAQEIAEKVVEPDLPKKPVYSVSQRDKLIVSTIMRQIDQQGREKNEILELLEKERAEIKNIYDTLRSKENLIDILLAKILEKDSLLGKYENAKCVVLEKLAKERVEFERFEQSEPGSEEVIVLHSSSECEETSDVPANVGDTEKVAQYDEEVPQGEDVSEASQQDDLKAQEYGKSLNQEYQDCGEYGEILEEKEEGRLFEKEEKELSEDSPKREEADLEDQSFDKLEKSEKPKDERLTSPREFKVTENSVSSEEQSENIEATKEMGVKVCTIPKNTHTQKHFVPYKSALSGLRAYKLGPFFDREKLSSATFSNKIDPEVQLCPRDLSKGSCNYNECRFQHIKDTRQDGTHFFFPLLTFSSRYRNCG